MTSAVDDSRFTFFIITTVAAATRSRALRSGKEEVDGCWEVFSEHIVRSLRGLKSAAEMTFL